VNCASRGVALEVATVVDLQERALFFFIVGFSRLLAPRVRADVDDPRGAFSSAQSTRLQQVGKGNRFLATTAGGRRP